MNTAVHKIFYKKLFIRCWLILSLVLANTACAESRDAHWLGGIGFYAAELERKHIHLFHSISERDFGREIQELKAADPNLSDNEVYVALMRLTRKIDVWTHILPAMGRQS